MKKKIIIALIAAVFSTPLFATTYYVSYASGLDTYNGTSLSTPFKTITKAISSAVAGDIIYLRGGTHVYTSKINISKNGNVNNRFYLLAYPGDATRPVLDFSGLPSGTRGVQLSGTFWTIRGIDFYKAPDNGMHIDGAYNIIEFCSFYENVDTGLQLANGANNNQIINCDSYFNKDATDGNADGFAAKLDVGTGNSFRGCRAWQNSDDGWDGLLTAGLGTNPATTYDSCWCFMNGYLKSGSASAGNGNGFKMGGNNEAHDATLTRCLSAYNRVKGFDQNNNNGSMILYNCTGYKNKPNFGMNNNNPNSGEVMVVKNCVSFDGLSSDVFRTVCTRTNNSWQLSGTPATADFVSVDSLGLRNPRNADGSLPAIPFMHLSSTSILKDAGVNVGLPYNGTAPDIGAFELPTVAPVVLSQFDAVYKNNQIVLNWKTVTEINNKGWEIEKVFASGLNPFVWQKIGAIDAANTNNSSYNFIDANVAAGNTYQYRLKQIDIDGKVTYSNVITIKIASGKQNTSIKLYPNPIKDFANLQLNIAENANLQLVLINQAGQIVQTILNEDLQEGAYTRRINFTNIANGTYYIKAVNNSNIEAKIVVINR